MMMHNLNPGALSHPRPLLYCPSAVTKLTQYNAMSTWIRVLPLPVCEILAQEQELFCHAEWFRTCVIDILGIVQNVLVYILFGIGVVAVKSSEVLTLNQVKYLQW